MRPCQAQSSYTRDKNCGSSRGLTGRSGSDLLQPPARGHRLRHITGWAVQHLHPPLGNRIERRHVPTGRLLAALAIYGNVVTGFHAVSSGRDDGVGRRNDMSGGAVILDQELRSCTVVGLELADEADGRPGEGVDVLIVIAHCKQAEPKLLIAL